MVLNRQKLPVILSKREALSKALHVRKYLFSTSRWNVIFSYSCRRHFRIRYNRNVYMPVFKRITSFRRNKFLVLINTQQTRVHMTHASLFLFVKMEITHCSYFARYFRASKYKSGIRANSLSTAFLMIERIWKSLAEWYLRMTDVRRLIQARVWRDKHAANAALADRIGSRGLFNRVYNYTSPVPRGALSGLVTYCAVFWWAVNTSREFVH